MVTRQQAQSYAPRNQVTRMKNALHLKRWVFWVRCETKLPEPLDGGAFCIVTDSHLIAGRI